jgi:hypothetical protein
LRAVVVLALARNSTEQIEYVEFNRRMTQQMGKVAESLRILQTKSVPAVADGPVLALPAEDPLSRETGARPRVGTSGARSRGLRTASHLHFCKPFQFPVDHFHADRTIGGNPSPQNSLISGFPRLSCGPDEMCEASFHALNLPQIAPRELLKGNPHTGEPTMSQQTVLTTDEQKLNDAWEEHLCAEFHAHSADEAIPQW